jgi:hypothetical protein
MRFVRRARARRLRSAVPSLNGLRPTSAIFAPTYPGPQERRDRDSHQEQSEDQQCDAHALSVAARP